MLINLQFCYRLIAGDDTATSICEEDKKLDDILKTIKDKGKIESVKCLSCSSSATKEVYDGFDNLKILIIPHFVVSDSSILVTWLLKLTKLEYLDLRYSEILTDMSLESIPKSVKILKLSSNKFASLTTKCDYSNIVEAYLDNNDIEKFYTNKECKATELQVLDLSFNLIKNFNEIHWNPFSKLKTLKMDNCNLKQAPSFADLPSLETVYLSHNNMETINKIEHEKLKNLDLSFNKLKDFSLIGKIPNLEILNFQNNELKSSLNIVEKLDELRELKVSFNAINTIAFGDNMLRNLEIFDLENNQLEMLEFKKIMSLPKLKVLNLINNQIKEIDYLERLSSKLHFQLIHETKPQEIDRKMNEIQLQLKTLESKSGQIETLISQKNNKSIVVADNSAILSSLNDLKTQVTTISKPLIGFGSIIFILFIMFTVTCLYYYCKYRQRYQNNSTSSTYQLNSSLNFDNL